MIAIAALAAAAACQSAPPSIIFILSDDLGYGDYNLATEVNASSFRIPTPNIERLAESGVQFSRGYSMQTGRHLGHCTIRGNDGAYTPLLPTDLSVAKVMKRAGYRTAVVGKWGLGNFGTSGYPLGQGFDFYVGQDTQVGCHDWYPLTVRNNTINASVVNTEPELDHGQCLGPSPKCYWANDLCRDEGIKFIRDAVTDKTPYFLYLATTTPHAGFLNGNGSDNPPWFWGDNPVPYAYSQRFLNETGPGWDNQQTQFAAAVWAQDKIVGAVLDELETLGTAEQTVVFFSGDNGPDDHPFELMDDTGVFRGKKRSLHEGGIRQTIVVHWPGTITGRRVTDRLFTFYDFLPTAADLTGLPSSEWGPTDGLSAKDVILGGGGSGSGDVAAAASPSGNPNRYIYIEYCHYGTVDGLLPQVYKDGWVQAIRWDDNATEHRTEWKAIRSNSDDSTLLLYNLTADQSESHPLIGPPNVMTHVGAMTHVADPAVARARAIVLAQMAEAHVEDPYWKSSANASDGCCNSCFNPAGCSGGCKKIGPPPPPPPPPVAVTPASLGGVWVDGDGSTHTLAVDAATLSVATAVARSQGGRSVRPDAAQCWSAAAGTVSADGRKVSVRAGGDGDTCAGVPAATGAVSAGVVKRVVDTEYVHVAPVLRIRWSGDGDDAALPWAEWTRQVGPFVPEYELAP